MSGALTFSINASRLGGGMMVSKAEALLAMRVAFDEFGLVAPWHSRPLCPGVYRSPVAPWP